jgi:hypothetical protein
MAFTETADDWLMIESSVFGAEFVPTTDGMEALCGIQCILFMMGVPIDGPVYV